MRKPELKILVDTYGKWREFLGSKGDHSNTFENFYKKEVLPALKRANLSKAAFDEEKFPSLHEGLVLAGRIDRENLPNQWNLEALRTSVGTDLERLLLAYIWKRGELWRVQHVLTGLADRKRSYDSPEKDVKERVDEDGPTVMWQFGRHLASPENEPIFDQHTSRHRIVFEWLKKAGSLEKLADLERSEKLTTRRRCREYLAWWKENIRPRVGRANKSVESRADALLWADRTMFALGKAAAYRSDRETGTGKTESP